MGDRPIAFHPNLSRVAGSLKAGLFLSQAMYWQNRVPLNRDGWWWHTQDEWTAETTMSRRECDSARKILRELGVLETDLRGSPATTWYRVDLVRLDEMLEDFAERRDRDIDQGSSKCEPLPCTKAPIQYGGKRQTSLAVSANDTFNTEITTENNQGGCLPNAQTKTENQPAEMGRQRNRPGLPADAPELVELSEYVAGEIATAQGRAVSESMLSQWLAQLRILVASGLAVDAIRAGWDFGRGHTAYGVAVMTPGGFNRHHEGLIALALDARKAGKSGSGGQPACKGVDGGGCDQPATMGSSGRNTHCGDCFQGQADADMARLLEADQ